MTSQALRMICGLLLLGSASAGAQPYVGAQLGYADGQFTLGAPYNGTVDDSSVMLGITAGVGLGSRWAIEGGAQLYEGFDGRATPCQAGDTCTLAVQSIDDNDATVYRLAIVRRAFLGRAQIYGQAGYYRTRLDTNIGLPDNRFTERGLLLAAGARWQLREPWNVSVEMSRLDNHISQLGVGFGAGIRPSAERRSRRAQ